MGASPGVNGQAIALLASGGVLMYSALKTATVPDTIRALLKGQEPAPAGDGFLALIKQIPQSAPNDAKATGNTTKSVGPGQAIADGAAKYLGVPYRWGASSPSGMDCSGLVNYVLGHDLGHAIPGSLTGKYSGHGPVTMQYYEWGGATTVPRTECRAGDLVCWPNHIAIATGPNDMIAAPHAGTVVQRQKIYGGCIIRRVH